MALVVLVTVLPFMAPAGTDLLFPPLREICRAPLPFALRFQTESASMHFSLNLHSIVTFRHFLPATRSCKNSRIGGEAFLCDCSPPGEAPLCTCAVFPNLRLFYLSRSIFCVQARNPQRFVSISRSSLPILPLRYFRQPVPSFSQDVHVCSDGRIEIILTNHPPRPFCVPELVSYFLSLPYNGISIIGEFWDL